MNIRYEAGSDHMWSMILCGVFTSLALIFISILYLEGVDFTQRMGVWEFVILSLAVFRLTRLLVYDTIAQFVRDWFLDKQQLWKEDKGLYEVMRTKPKKGLKRKLSELFGCPWCAGVWISLFVVFFHYLTPLSWIVFVLLAIAGVSTFIQLLANYTGWLAEGKKKEVSGKP